jgi:uncharacterized phage-associated protein
MQFFFNARKAMQAAAALLRSEETKQTSYLRLLKLLYIADRESMRETGRPITGDRVLAMDHGPVLEGVYDLIQGTGYHLPTWARHFQISGYHVKLAKDPGVGMLSKYELRKLHEIGERYATKSDWDIVEDTHRFAEWKKNYVENTATRIPVEHILEAVGRGADIPEIMQDEQDREQIDRLLKDW